MRADEVMTTSPIMVPETMRLVELAGLLRSRRISGAPVVNDDGDLIGVVTITDLFKFINSLKHQFSPPNEAFVEKLREQKLNSFVKDVMTKEVYSVRKETSVIEILSTVLEKNIHTIPVVGEDGKEIIGIIGRHDLILACLMADW